MTEEPSTIQPPFVVPISGSTNSAKRKSEAQSNVEKLATTVIHAQLAEDPRADILDEWTVLHALYGEKLCPGLWPFCEETDPRFAFCHTT